MTNKVTEDFSRRWLDFNTPKVVEILPEHFQSDYPKLIALLEAYQEYMDSDGSINDELSQVLKARDVDGVSLRFLDYLLREIGAGISADKFNDPREIARNFPDYFKTKGTFISAKSFFRGLYGEEVEILYPKDNIFILNDSLIGAESLKFIQNGKLYQVLSILIKSSRSINEWRDLYKKYVHPAGFYLGSEVIIEGIVGLNLSTMPDVIPDENAGLLVFEDFANMGIGAPFTNLTGLYTESDGQVYRIDLDRQLSEYDSVSVGQILSQYNYVIDLGTPNSPTADDTISVDASNTIETADRSLYDSDFSRMMPPWLLSGGFLNDYGIWIDSSLWEDGVFIPPPPLSGWAVASGNWADAGVWDDGENWTG